MAYDFDQSIADSRTIRRPLD